MTTSPVTVISPEAATALREIFADPSLPVGTVLAGPGGERLNALREAHDFVTTHRLAAAALWSTGTADTLLAALGEVSPELVSSLRWHAALGPVLAGLEPTKARNALLGDVHRGGLLTWATAVRSWSWYGGAVPSVSAPLQRAEAEFEVDEHPALYDTIVAWEPGTSALIAVPTYREHLSWAPAAAGGWTVTAAHVTFHRDDLIPLAQQPNIPGASIR